MNIHDNGLACVACAGLKIDQASDFLVSSWQGSSPTRIVNHAGPAIKIVDSQLGRNDHAVMASCAGAVEFSRFAPGDLLDLKIDHVTVSDSTSVEAFSGMAAAVSITVQNSILAFNPGGGIVDATIAPHHNLRFENGSGSAALDPSEIAADPLFGSALDSDYHLQSEHGRFDPDLGWINDVVTSPGHRPR